MRKVRRSDLLKKKTIKKTGAILCLLLLFSLTAGLVPFARADAAGSFTDVTSDSYYYNEVTSMASQGVVNGYGNGTFLPQNPVSNAEAIKLVVSMAGVNTAGYTGETSPWYIDVWSWAQDNGIVSSGTVPDSYASRAQICAYIASVYKLDTGATTSNVFSDTDSKVANTLYDYGIVKGIPAGDGTVAFGGGQSVKRCDTCIMLYRLSSQVQKPVWPAITPKPTAYTLDKSHYAVSKPAKLSSYSDYIQAWDYMLCNKVLSQSFALPDGYTETQLDQVLDSIQSAYDYSCFDYMEYAAFLNQYGLRTSGGYISSSGRVTGVSVTFQLANASGSGSVANLTDAQVRSEISTFEQTCDGIVTGLYKDGSLKTTMSVKDKAYVLCRYVATHTAYDESERYYNGYDAAVRHSAVCQGYTSMYNYLCNIAGVPMEAMTGYVGGSGHAWSRIYQNGTYYNVDVTWCDPIPDQPGYCDDEWFWVSDNYLKTCSEPRTFDIDTTSKAA